VASPSGGLDHVSGGLSHRRGPFSSRSAPPDINIVGNRGGPHGFISVCPSSWLSRGGFPVERCTMKLESLTNAMAIDRVSVPRSAVHRAHAFFVNPERTQRAKCFFLLLSLFVFLHHRNQHTHTYCTVQITHTQIIFVSDSTKHVLPPPEPYDSSRASRHKIAHFLPLFLAACGGTSTTRMASSKTFFSLGRRGLGLE
jgi:hypothetical protein